MLNLFTGSSGYKLVVGDGANTAGMILNGGSQIGGGSRLGSGVVFDGPDTVIYAGGAATSAIDAPLTVTGGGGMTKFGQGTLALQGQATYSGPTVIAQGVLAIMRDDALPTATRVHLSGVPGSINSSTNGTHAALRLSFANQTIAELSGGSSVARVDLAGNTLTVNQATDSTYAGVIISAPTSTTPGRFVKSGAGTLTLANRYVAPVGSSSFPNLYGRLTISGGAVVAASPFVLPAAAFLREALLVLFLPLPQRRQVCPSRNARRTGSVSFIPPSPPPIGPIATMPL